MVFTDDVPAFQARRLSGRADVRDGSAVRAEPYVTGNNRVFIFRWGIVVWVFHGKCYWPVLVELVIDNIHACFFLVHRAKRRLDTFLRCTEQVIRPIVQVDDLQELCR